MELLDALFLRQRYEESPPVGEKRHFSSPIDRCKGTAGFSEGHFSRGFPEVINIPRWFPNGLINDKRWERAWVITTNKPLTKLYNTYTIHE
jgi:hypothetical protein